MTVLHVLTDQYPPAHGGLEIWTERLCTSLVAAGLRVFVYVIEQDVEEVETIHSNGVEISYISNHVNFLLEPLFDQEISNSLKEREIPRIRHLCVRNAILKRLSTNPDDHHILLSNFIVTAGFLAVTVAESLRIPHIACVVGTDFSRGFKTPKERGVFELVVRTATVIVTLNSEQALQISNTFGHKQITTIHTSLSEFDPALIWAPTYNDKIRLFSDIGFSHKKATHLLFYAFKQLVAEGLPLSLTICGDIQPSQSIYWQNLISEYSCLFKDDVRFLNHLTLNEIASIIMESDIYCSPTLGEGCSLARCAALAYGIPMVTTLCGEISDLVTGASHIRLALPGDYGGFVSQLRAMCRGMLESRLHPNAHDIQGWRSHFDPERELNDWLATIYSATLNHQASLSG